MRNRTAGHNWERFCAKILSKILNLNILTSRYASRRMDDLKIDLYFEEGNKFNFQCKNTCTRLNYPALLEEIPDNAPPVLLHKFTKKKGKRFYEEGKYVIMYFDDFLNLINDTDTTDK